MRIEQLEIENFRAIEKVIIDARSTMVVIAGPNGCGKSCILDGIRFVKSTYGGYGPNEWDQWLGEFQIDRQREPWEMKKLLRDKSRDAKNCDHINASQERTTVSSEQQTRHRGGDRD